MPKTGKPTAPRQVGGPANRTQKHADGGRDGIRGRNSAARPLSRAHSRQDADACAVGMEPGDRWLEGCGDDVCKEGKRIEKRGRRRRDNNPGAFVRAHASITGDPRPWRHCILSKPSLRGTVAAPRRTTFFMDKRFELPLLQASKILFSASGSRRRERSFRQEGIVSDVPHVGSEGMHLVVAHAAASSVATNFVCCGDAGKEREHATAIGCASQTSADSRNKKTKPRREKRRRTSLVVHQ